MNSGHESKICGFSGVDLLKVGELNKLPPLQQLDKGVEGWSFTNIGMFFMNHYRIETSSFNENRLKVQGFFCCNTVSRNKIE